MLAGDGEQATWESTEVETNRPDVSKVVVADGHTIDPAVLRKALTAGEWHIFVPSPGG